MKRGIVIVAKATKDFTQDKAHTDCASELQIIYPWIDRDELTNDPKACRNQRHQWVTIAVLDYFWSSNRRRVYLHFLVCGI